MIKIIFLLFLLTGCQTHIGLAVHPQEFDAPEFVGSNPLGVVRVEHKQNDYTVFYEHVSSVMDFEGGYGLNMIGITKRVD